MENQVMANISLFDQAFNLSEVFLKCFFQISRQNVQYSLFLIIAVQFQVYVNVTGK